MLNLLVWWRVMHKFKIGERLFPARSVGFSVPDVACVVVKRLPMRDGEFEYQIKSLTEPDERVARESQLRSKHGRPHTSPNQFNLRHRGLCCRVVSKLARGRQSLAARTPIKTLGSGMENQISSTLPSPFYPLAVAPAEQLDSLR